jgi:hypothetical protein
LKAVSRDDVVLISAEDYARLRRYEQKPIHVSQLPREVVDGKAARTAPA